VQRYATGALPVENPPHSRGGYASPLALPANDWRKMALTAHSKPFDCFGLPAASNYLR